MSILRKSITGLVVLLSLVFASAVFASSDTQEADGATDNPQDWLYASAFRIASMGQCATVKGAEDAVACLQKISLFEQPIPPGLKELLTQINHVDRSALRVCNDEEVKELTMEGESPMTLWACLPVDVQQSGTEKDPSGAMSYVGVLAFGMTLVNPETIKIAQIDWLTE